MECINWMTPIGLLTGKKPDVSLLRVFGCGAYVLIPPERRVNKLTPKSQYVTCLGFVDGIKGFLFMNSENRLVTGATALFDEKDFPCCKPGTQFRGDVLLWDENIEPNTPSEDDDQDDEDFTIPHDSGSQPPPEEPSDSDDFYEETPSNRRGLNTPKAGENLLLQTPRPPRTHVNLPDLGSPPLSPTPTGNRQGGVPRHEVWIPQGNQNPAAEQQHLGSTPSQQDVPRRSDRQRRPVNRPDNIYGNCNPTETDQFTERD